MKAWRLYGFNDLRLDDLPEPEIPPLWVLLDVLVVQPSITEALLYRGIETLMLDYVSNLLATRAPVQLFGHELTGRVVKVGSEVADLEVGDRVVARAKLPCHNCPVCWRGRLDDCRAGPIIGWQIPGAFAEQVALPAEALAKLPPEVSDSEGACMQPLSDCVAAVQSAGPLLGATVVVVGQGGMGLSTLQVARVSGASQVIGIDIRDDVLKKAQQVGATEVLNATRDDVRAAVRDFTGGRGADVVFETAGGSPKQGLSGQTSLMQAIELVRDGGTIVGISWFGVPVQLDIDVFRHKCLKYVFPDPSTPEILVHAVRLVASKRVAVEPLITHQFLGIERIPEALEIMADKARHGVINPPQVVVKGQPLPRFSQSSTNPVREVAQT